MAEDYDDMESVSESGESENEEEEEEDGADITANSSEENPDLTEVLELLFRLMIALSTEEVMDGRPASTLLVYFSRILGCTADSAGFLAIKVAQNVNSVESAVRYLNMMSYDPATGMQRSVRRLTRDTYKRLPAGRANSYKSAKPAV
ncbi:hypothetical protein FOFC_08872 [Fusarium oxysporum]|nr:hypothetical protein FOFC_08872 [Fusarium oxysporum]